MWKERRPVCWLWSNTVVQQHLFYVISNDSLFGSHTEEMNFVAPRHIFFLRWILAITARVIQPRVKVEAFLGFKCTSCLHLYLYLFGANDKIWNICIIWKYCNHKQLKTTAFIESKSEVSWMEKWWSECVYFKHKHKNVKLGSLLLCKSGSISKSLSNKAQTTTLCSYCALKRKTK